jgi:hypothetical protein
MFPAALRIYHCLGDCAAAAKWQSNFCYKPCTLVSFKFILSDASGRGPSIHITVNCSMYCSSCQCQAV